MEEEQAAGRAHSNASIRNRRALRKIHAAPVDVSGGGRASGRTIGRKEALAVGWRPIQKAT